LNSNEKVQKTEIERTSVFKVTLLFSSYNRYLFELINEKIFEIIRYITNKEQNWKLLNNFNIIL